MKKQILMLVIGILIGAIITTGVFLVLKGNSGENGGRMNMGEPPTMDGNTTGGGPGGSKGEMKQDSKENKSIDNTNTDSTNTSET